MLNPVRKIFGVWRKGYIFWATRNLKLIATLGGIVIGAFVVWGTYTGGMALPTSLLLGVAAGALEGAILWVTLPGISKRRLLP